MPETPQSRQEKPLRSSIFIGFGAAWAVLVVLGITATILVAFLPGKSIGAVALGLVVSASVIAGVFAARAHRNRR